MEVSTTGGDWNAKPATGRARYGEAIAITIQAIKPTLTSVSLEEKRRPRITYTSPFVQDLEAGPRQV